MSAAIDITQLEQRRAALRLELRTIDAALVAHRGARVRAGTKTARVLAVLPDWHRRTWIASQTGLSRGDVAWVLMSLIRRGVIERRGTWARREYRRVTP